MSTSKTKLGGRIALLASLVLCVSGSAGATIASASKWNEIAAGASAPATLSGSLSLKLNGGSPVTCPVVSQAAMPVSMASNDNSFPGNAYFTGGHSSQRCSNGELFGMNLVLSAGDYTPYGWSVGFASQSTPQPSAFGGGWLQIGFGVLLTNGTGGLPSKVTFVNKLIGYQGGNITATGTLALTRNAGGTLTLV